MQPALLADLHRRHLDQLDAWLDDALGRARARDLPLDGVVFHAGRQATYHADDRHVPFQAAAHFRRWVPPLAGPEHVVLARPGQPVVTVRVAPRDFWFDTAPPPPSHWEDNVSLEVVERFDQVADVLGPLGNIAYVGPSIAAATTLGIEESQIEPAALMSALDWHRATKTDYEIALTRVACERAAEGHRAAHGCFLDGGSERDVTLAYLRAADQLEADLPYDAIVAFDEKAAVLHYENKRGADAAPGRLLLLDAGAGHHGYASDISRTWTVDDAPDAMRALVEGVDALERRLVEAIAPGRDFAELHLEAHRGVAELLHEVGIVRSSPAEAVDRQLTRAFFPHGIGHGLGLAVHEVGGRLADPDGGERTPPDGHVLRTTRRLEPGHLVTIEPGLYFIPMLLEPWRQGADAAVVDWDLVDQLTPFGGVRIEDDVLCTDDGFEDLTRPLLAGPRGV